ncbi:MAG: GNAT family N-acetyltransferase [Parvibaculum sp.]
MQANAGKAMRRAKEGTLWTRPLFTPRLSLRWFHAGDAGALAALGADAIVRERTETIPHPFDTKAAFAWIDQSDQLRAEGTSFRFAVIDRVDNRLIGVSALEQCEGAFPEIAYWLGRSFWDRGFGKEAVTATLAFARDVLRFSQIDALVYAENTASAAVLKSLLFDEFRFETIHVPERGGNRLVRRFRLSLGQGDQASQLDESQVA